MNQFSSRRVGFALALTVLLIFGCGDKSNGSPAKDVDAHTTLTLAHFWSEPAQKAALQALITEFEAAEPTVDVDLIDLNWSDGKTKMQLSFNSGTPPDIVHVGLEWTPEFSAAGVLHPLPDSFGSILPSILPQALGALTTDGQVYALPWFVNTRSMLVNVPEGSNLPEIRTWQDLDALMSAAERAGMIAFGVNAAEPHNVLKKSLPIIWSAGSDLFSRTPLHASFDDAAVVGLERYCAMAARGRIEASRTLDDMFVDGRLSVWITGAWIQAMLQRDLTADQVLTLPSIPTRNSQDSLRGWSILGGDALAVTQKSPNSDAAWRLVNFLTSYTSCKTFVESVPDAGLPARSAALTDPLWQVNPVQRGFVEQIGNARPLPWSPVFVEAETILENAIMEAVYGRMTAAEALESARVKIMDLESAN